MFARRKENIPRLFRRKTCKWRVVSIPPAPDDRWSPWSPTLPRSCRRHCNVNARLQAVSRPYRSVVSHQIPSSASVRVCCVWTMCGKLCVTISLRLVRNYTRTRATWVTLLLIWNVINSSLLYLYYYRYRATLFRQLVYGTTCRPKQRNIKIFYIIFITRN